MAGLLEPRRMYRRLLFKACKSPSELTLGFSLTRDGASGFTLGENETARLGTVFAVLMCFPGFLAVILLIFGV